MFVTEAGEEVALAAHIEEAYDAAVALVEVPGDGDDDGGHSSTGGAGTGAGAGGRDVSYQWVKLAIPPEECIKYIATSNSVPTFLKSWLNTSATMHKM